MVERSHLIENVKKWIHLDEEFKRHRREMRALRDEKKNLTDSLVRIMKNNEIDCLDMNSGKIVYCKQKTKAPLN